MNRVLPLLLLTLLFPWQTVAQNTADLEVVVTADRVDKVETETTATVSVITAEEIEASGAASLVDLLETLPGVQFKSYSGPSQAMISMGGFGENSYGRVVVLVDGRLQNNIDMRSVNWMSVPLASVERVEVLHGGGGVLYGSGAVGGVVNIVTRETDAPWELEVGGSYGSFMTHRESVQAGASGAAGSIRVGGEFYSTDGYRDRSAGNFASATVAGSLYPSDRLSFELDFGYTRSFYEMPGGLSEAQYEDDPTQAVNQADESTEHEVGISVTGEYLLTDSITLEALAGYGYKNIAPDMPSAFISNYTDRIYSTYDFQTKLSQTGTLTLFSSTTVLGLDLRSSSLDFTEYAEKERITSLGGSSEFDVALFSGGAYLNTDINVKETIGISAGFRYDLAQTSALNGDESVDDNKLHSGPAWNTGVRWNPTPVSKFYLRYERMFRYPFTDEQASLYYAPLEFLADLEAEKGYLYEFGGLYHLPLNTRVDFRGYLMDMTDEIAYVGTFPTGKNENYGKTRRIGVEAGLTVQPVDLVKVETSYGYVLPTFTNGDDEGKQIPLVSNHEIEAGMTLYGPYRIELSTDASFRSGYYEAGDTANAQNVIDGYYLFNAGLRWKTALADGELVLAFNVDNLLDESYSPFVYYSSFNGYYPGAGRSFTLSGTYRY